MLDCGAPGRLTSRIFGAVGRGGGGVNALTPFGTGGGAQWPKRSSSSGWTSSSGRSDTTKILHVVGPQPALLERHQIVAAEILDRRRIAARRAAIGMVRPVQHDRQQPPRDPRRVLLRLRDPGQRLRPDAVDVARSGTPASRTMSVIRSSDGARFGDSALSMT